MSVVDLFQWWYFRGWGVAWHDLKTMLGNTVDLFSVGQLLKTLFKPFRQISANSSGDALDAKISAFFDRLVSRIIGAIVRIGIIFAGILVILAELIFIMIMVVVWPLVPFLPIAGIMLSIAGVTF